MGKIRILDEHIANQIAAGEVVERPSSVIKELVENSIDAGSTKIDVTVEEGGLQLIRVADNGSGMDADDCRAAFFRHATSKIASGKDLFRIRSLGFRGEALPSIAAVSKVECVTSAQADGLGSKIVIEGGTVKSFEETAAARGTDIRVKELFYNTPARLKYMKTVQTELGHISDYMYRLALAHPQVAFTLRHNGNLLLQTLGNGDRLQVIAAIYGSSVAKGMIRVSGENPDYTVSGYVSRPELTRANRSAVSVIVNGRYIRSHALAHALLNAYHTLLPINRFPIVVLHIGMDAALVDVNVHPSKLEVRFSKEAELVRFVEQTVREALQSEVLIPAAGKSAGAKTAVVQERIDFYRTDRNDAPLPPQQRMFTQAETEPREPWRPDEANQRNGNGSSSSHSPSVGGTYPVNGDKHRRRTEAASPQIMREIAPAADGENIPQAPAFPELHPIGQMHGTYILAQNEEGLFLIDQHAAHERINYEYYYEQFGNPAQASQELLIPITLEFTPAEAELLKERLHLFELAGVYMEHFGGGAFIVRSYPHWLPRGEEKSVIEEMADWIITEKKAVDLAKLREKSAILCSCKASIKANDKLSMAEIEALLHKLRACRNPYTCPHGRPIVVSFSTYELEKMFKRVM